MVTSANIRWDRSPVDEPIFEEGQRLLPDIDLNRDRVTLSEALAEGGICKVRMSVAPLAGEHIALDQGNADGVDVSGCYNADSDDATTLVHCDGSRTRL